MLSRWFALVLAVGCLAGLPARSSADKVPDALKAVLDKAADMELYSLNPVKPKEASKDDFHGWTVLGKAAIKEEETRKKIVDALAKGAEENKTNKRAFCFNPRHGLRVTHDGKTYDLVICFECYQVQVFAADKEEKEKGYTTERSPQATLDKVLKDAGVKLPK